MKTRLVLLLSICVSLCAEAKIIIVNTTNNISPRASETNLVQAIGLLQDGDTIQFNIPGSGPFYLVTPTNNGYPAITNNNITIDGFSQAGAVPNSNPILSSNNAHFQIVLDSRAGGFHIEPMPGYSDHEGAIFFVNGATNISIQGFCFLGPGTGDLNNPTPANPNTYAISFAQGASGGRVSGCQIGVDLDGQTVNRFCCAVTGFEGNSGVYVDNATVGVGLFANGSAAARAEFNVLVGAYIPVVLEGSGHRISGNFFNVFPNGTSDYQCNGIVPQEIQAFIEIGRTGNNILIGTDGDGANDSDERNIFGGVTWADDGELLEWYDSASTNVVVAGNYFGVAIDGVTRFTNSQQVLGGLHGSTTMRFGSDFNGVSDSIEGNLVTMNYPFDWLFSDPGASFPPLFASMDAGARISFRGNSLIGNNLAPFSYADGYGTRLEDFTNFYAGYLDTNALIPVLSTNSSQGILRGGCALGMAPYTNVIIDVYLADEEGWTNGQQFQFAELAYTDPATGNTLYQGFPQGKTWLATFTANGPQNLDPTPAQFAFDISSLGLSTNVLITLTASYSIDPPSTPNGRAQTSPFAFPITLRAAPRLTIAQAGANIALIWPASDGQFTIQSSISLSPSVWTNLVPEPTPVQMGADYKAIVAFPTATGFYRLAR
ncbi:MAG TPA: hypothetical protein VGN61_09460 [Verrucomicrobiae bacterium]|jgi:hypothetical protein